VKNLFSDVPRGADSEIVTRLLSEPGVRIERIVSNGQATPPGDWYDQDWAEWVVVLCGSAGLLIEGEPEPRVLGPGDYLHLPARLRHRVEWTMASGPTVWLAVHHR
jgi:cupin 2 domain-containing protein